jgi:hypothetical protein
MSVDAVDQAGAPEARSSRAGEGIEGRTLSYLSIGSLGTGFGEESLARGIASGIDFIGADAGSVDGGPLSLAGGPPSWSDAAYERDLSLLIRASRKAGVPLLVGSCALSGRDWGVDHFAAMARATAKEFGLSFKLARIYSEVPTEYVLEALSQDRLHPLDFAPDFDEDAIKRSIRTVGVMGVEPFQAALAAGADVILAGRATDAAIFAAIPMSRGFDPGLCWHAGKIAECGTASAEPRRRLDVLHVEMSADSFIVKPLADDIRCTPFSVAAHQLHEVSDPLTMIEPGWTTDLSQATYVEASPTAVRVAGSVSRKTPDTVKLESVESAGFQRMFMFSVRDTTILHELDPWIAGIQDDIAIRCREILGEGALEKCDVNVRIYGRDGTMGPREPIKQFEGHEAFFLIDVVGPDAAICDSVSSVIWYAYLHAKSPTWRGGSTVAWPFTRSIHNLGEVFRFNAHHVIDVDDSLQPFRIEYEVVEA